MSSSDYYRSIHYLGNKSKLASEIISCISAERDGVGAVADLFAGTGVVSNAISNELGATAACDIQDYSRVLTSALILDYPFPSDCMNACTMRAREFYGHLEDAYRPLLRLEEEALHNAASGDNELLFSIVESGHLHPAYSFRNVVNKELFAAKEKCRCGSRDVFSDDMITKYFGGIFFSYKQALILDSLHAAISEEPPELQLFGLASLLSTASRIANTVGGQFAQPLNVRRKNGAFKHEIASRVVRDRKNDPWTLFGKGLRELEKARHPRSDNSFFREDCLGFLRRNPAQDFSAIYADPPYSRYHYSRYYHVLETICLYDSPKISANPTTGKPSKGIYRESRYQSPFSTRKGAPAAFEELFLLASKRSKVLLLSYSPFPGKSASTPRMATIDQLRNLALRHYRRVEISTPSVIRHSKFNKLSTSLEVSDNAEVFILCKQ